MELDQSSLFLVKSMDLKVVLMKHDIVSPLVSNDVRVHLPEKSVITLISLRVPLGILVTSTLSSDE